VHPAYYARQLHGHDGDAKDVEESPALFNVGKAIHAHQYIGYEKQAAQALYHWKGRP
jgi:hypothetical protein